ncbi:hypothetical protein [Methylobacter sp. S3L5C]|uniref:hypothetical protein n=1 Tax=Methylobacter sp. S3L5C TaxID=2839024 RepID=UPI001FADBD1D|nr:hypothetical protein [Methylobacter sp. S3L5C]UOA10397.1 hypothetical protein KKZ03_09280 [Methylobacter sp. S3L5C]
MKFNDTGTLTNWQLDDINIVEPLHSKENGSSRGGVFLCIPNFEALSPPFSIKHGEYRTTPCDNKLPHTKNLSAPAENNWGNIDVITDWEEIEAINSKTLKVTTTIRALSDTAWVRPGFHPYFSVTQNSFINIGATRIDTASLPHDSMQKYKAASLSEEVKLTTANYTVSINCNLSPITENLSIVFVIWSDKKQQYVCIEPVIGNQPAQDGLPKPLTLVKNEELVMVFTICATRTGFVDIL